MPHKAAGAGSPISFHCPVARRERVWPDAISAGHQITLTGRTKPYKAQAYSAIGSRSTFTSREYECSCGHVGWSNHVYLERLERQDRT